MGKEKECICYNCAAFKKFATSKKLTFLEDCACDSAPVYCYKECKTCAYKTKCDVYAHPKNYSITLNHCDDCKESKCISNKDYTITIKINELNAAFSNIANELNKLYDKLTKGDFNG